MRLFPPTTRKWRRCSEKLHLRYAPLSSVCVCQSLCIFLFEADAHHAVSALTHRLTHSKLWPAWLAELVLFLCGPLLFVCLSLYVFWMWSHHTRVCEFARSRTQGFQMMTLLKPHLTKIEWRDLTPKVAKMTRTRENMCRTIYVKVDACHKRNAQQRNACGKWDDYWNFCPNFLSTRLQ